jgi:DNA-binding NtrC family response regulator
MSSVGIMPSVKVTGCSSPRALARRLGTQRFDMAVADWQTAGREGIATLGRIGIPLILISQPKYLREAYRIGRAAEILLETPVSNQELITLVTALIKRERAKQQEVPEVKSAATAAAGR